MMLRLFGLLLFTLLISTTTLVAQEELEVQNTTQEDNKQTPKEEIVESNQQLLEEKNISLKENVAKQVETSVKKEANNLLEKYMQKSDIDMDQFAKVTLKDSVLEALSFSENIKAQREKVVQAQLNLDDAIAEYFPTLDAEYSNETTKTTPSIVEDQKYSKVTDESYKFTFRQNLFNGGQTSALVENKKYLLDLEKNKYRIMLSDEIAKAVKAYFDVVFNKKSVEVNERNMKLLERILEIVTVKYESGALSLGDMTAIKAGVANAKSSLLKVKSSLAESLRYYEYIVGINFVKTLPFEKDFNVEVGDFDSLYDRALNTNPHLKNYFYNIQAQKYKVKQAQRKYAPRVDFEAGYEKILDGFAQEDEPFTQTENTTAGFKVTYNLFNGGKDKNGILRNYSSLRHLQYTLEEEKKKLKWNLSKLHTSVQTVKDVLQSTFSEVQSSRTTVQSYWEGFKLGEQDLQVLLQGQKQLNSAELEYVKFQSNMVKDFFKILEFTGDLLTYFDVDPDNRKFIDFSNSTYMYNNTYSVEAKVEAPLIKDEISAEKQIEQKINTLNSLLDFAQKLMNADPDDSTILIDGFKQLYEALDFAKANEIVEEYLVFDTLSENSQITNIAHGIFSDTAKANEKIEQLKQKSLNTKIQLESVGKVQELYKQYLEGLKIDLPEPQVQILEKVIKKTIPVVKIKKPVVYTTNPEFKKAFLDAKPSQYTISLASFRTMKEAVLFAQENEIEDDTFAFVYANAKLVKAVYGIYDTYAFAYDDLNTKLKQLKMKYEPIIETIGQNQKIYEQYIDLNIIEEPEYELDGKVIKPEPTKKIEEKVEPKPIEPKPAEEKVEPDVLEETPVEEKIEEEPVQVEAVEEKIEQKVELEAVEQKPVEKEIQQIENNTSFEQQFQNASKGSYTICLASLPNIQKAQQFIQENKLENSAIAIEVNNAYKVYHNIFNNRDEALQALSALDKRLQNNSPYINKIERLQIKANEIEKLQEPKKEEIVEEMQEIEEEESLLIQNEEEQIEENISEQQSQTTPETASLFEVIFLEAPQYYYTIALSSLPNIQKANDFINENNIQDKSLIVPTQSRPIVYYGVYSSKDEAISALKSLDERLQRNNPYINKIAKPQSLYKKFSQEMNNDA